MTSTTWRYTIDRDGDAHTVTLVGELDLSACEELQRILLDALTEASTGGVEADLSAVTFIDSSAISALIRAHNSAHARGGSFAITGSRGHVRRVLQVTGVLDSLSRNGRSTEPPTTAKDVTPPRPSEDDSASGIAASDASRWAGADGGSGGDTRSGC
jgi:anti-sigma B factor antagonist